jgi:hypothetical protein
MIDLVSLSNPQVHVLPGSVINPVLYRSVVKELIESDADPMHRASCRLANSMQSL